MQANGIIELARHRTKAGPECVGIFGTVSCELGIAGDNIESLINSIILPPTARLVTVQGLLFNMFIDYLN